MIENIKIRKINNEFMVSYENGTNQRFIASAKTQKELINIMGFKLYTLELESLNQKLEIDQLISDLNQYREV